MRRLRFPVPDLSESEKTYLDSDYSSGTILTVVNNYGFDTNDIVIVGEKSEEKTESQVVTNQEGHNTVNISSDLKFDHNKGCVVYRFRYDQVQVYRKRSGSWSLISTSNIQWDKKETIYVDKTSRDGDEYKYRLKNSSSGETSGYSPTIPASGFTSNKAGYVIQEARSILGDDSTKYVKDAEFLRQMNRIQEKIQALREDWWFLKVDTYKQDNGISGSASEDTYSLATYSDLNFIDTIKFNMNDGTTNVTYHLKQTTDLEMDYETRDETRSDDDYVEKYQLLPPDSSSDQGYIRVWPSPETGSYCTFYPIYYKKMSTIDDIMDEIEPPLVQIFIDYCLEYGFKAKENETKADYYGNKVDEGLGYLSKLNQSQTRAVGQPKALKTFRGRKAVSRYFQDHVVDRDAQVRKYF